MDVTKPVEFIGCVGPWMSQNPMNFMGFGAMGIRSHCRRKRFGPAATRSRDLASIRVSSNAVKRAFWLFFKSNNLGFGAFSGPNRPQEGLEKAPGSGPDRFAPFFSPADQF